MREEDQTPKYNTAQMLVKCLEKEGVHSSQSHSFGKRRFKIKHKHPSAGISSYAFISFFLNSISYFITLFRRLHRENFFEPALSVLLLQKPSAIINKAPRRIYVSSSGRFVCVGKVYPLFLNFISNFSRNR